jgi:hypothetical protein
MLTTDTYLCLPHILCIHMALMDQEVVGEYIKGDT